MKIARQRLKQIIKEELMQEASSLAEIVQADYEDMLFPDEDPDKRERDKDGIRRLASDLQEILNSVKEGGSVGPDATAREYYELNQRLKAIGKEYVEKYAQGIHVGEYQSLVIDMHTWSEQDKAFKAFYDKVDDQVEAAWLRSEW